MAVCGQLPPFDASGNQPFHWPVYFQSCRKANSHSSALAAVEHGQIQRPDSLRSLSSA